MNSYPPQGTGDASQATSVAIKTNTDLIPAVKAKTDLISTSVAKAPVYETISYSPGLIGGTDLEAATKTVDWTTLAASVGDEAKHYSASLTLPMSCTVNGVAKVIGTTETRLAIMRIGTRFEFIIDSMTAGTLNYSISVDDATGVIAANVLMAGSVTTTGTKLVVQDCLVGTKETIFNLLKDNAAHTFHIFFWVDAGNAVLSSVKVWEGVGNTVLSGDLNAVLLLNFTGMVQVAGSNTKVGTTSPTKGLSAEALAYQNNIYNSTSDFTFSGTLAFIRQYLYVRLYNTTTATDLNYVSAITFQLRSDN